MTLESHKEHLDLFKNKTLEYLIGKPSLCIFLESIVQVNKDCVNDSNVTKKCVIQIYNRKIAKYNHSKSNKYGSYRKITKISTTIVKNRYYMTYKRTAIAIEECNGNNKYKNNRDIKKFWLWSENDKSTCPILRDKKEDCSESTSKDMGLLVHPQKYFSDRKGQEPKIGDVDISARPKNFNSMYMIKKSKIDYGENVGILVIKYGTGVTNQTSAKDLDILILIHGNYNPASHEAQSYGCLGGQNSKIKDLDIQVRLFDSFVMGLVVGKPYNVSVAIDGKLQESHFLHENYWRFVQHLCLNLTFKKEKLLSELYQDSEVYYQDVQNEFGNGQLVNLIIAAYNYTCTLLQIIAIDLYPDIILPHDIYPISKVDNMKRIIDDKNAAKSFNNLVGIFKGDIPFCSLEEALDMALHLGRIFNSKVQNI